MRTEVRLVRHLLLKSCYILMGLLLFSQYCQGEESNGEVICLSVLGEMPRCLLNLTFACFVVLTIYESWQFINNMET